jgi:pyrroloquinoline-quinone synthase
MANDFVGELQALIDSRRSFGGHPLWLAIERGEVPRERLGAFAIQFFLQVREFPRAVSALHANCTDAEERIELAESLYEEETGKISGCGMSHPELFLKFGTALGPSRQDFIEAEALPGTKALIDWFELSTKQRSFIEGAAATNLAAEGQVPGAFGPFARAFEKHYGLSTDAVAFWDVHEIADREHSDIGNNIVIRRANSAEERARVRSAVEHSLEMWWQFFDDIERSLQS